MVVGRFEQICVFLRPVASSATGIIAKKTVLHNVIATEHVAGTRKVFVFDAAEDDVFCHYRLVFFVYVTIS